MFVPTGRELPTEQEKECPHAIIRVARKCAAGKTDEVIIVKSPYYGQRHACQPPERVRRAQKAVYAFGCAKRQCTQLKHRRFLLDMIPHGDKAVPIRAWVQRQLPVCGGKVISFAQEMGAADIIDLPIEASTSTV